MKPKIIVLTGPTASGKTALSLKLANSVLRGKAEIISADSRQVYRGLNIGTGKVRLKNGRAAGIPHDLIDVASPRRTFTVAQYLKLANAAIKKILKNSKIPFIVGGTGFYIESLLAGNSPPQVKPNLELRKGLEKLSTEKLYKKLKQADPRRAKTIDRHNKRRLIRALEIIESLGHVPPLPRRDPPAERAGRLGERSLILGLKLPDQTLRQRINRRVDTRLAGIIKEVKTLRQAQGMSWKRLINFGLEYRFVSWYLQGKLPKEEALEKLKIAIWQFARRQYTYLKRLPVLLIRDQPQAENKIKKFLEDKS